MCLCEINELDKTLHHQIRSHFLKMSRGSLCASHESIRKSDAHKVVCPMLSEGKIQDLTMANRVHKISSIVGGMLFVADNLYIHTAWHLATAIGVSTCNMLLEQCFRSNAKEIDFIKVTPKTTTMALLMEKASLYCTKWRQ
ncbi:uncharacterized protein LOC107647656 isoform X3 [Arachis ipaensis]|uniref:uncharacterized protein LOC107647656 isoform X3 n=1 Tax=Arachis ipaensis TaxID=130454 RepID=UPI000A2B5CA2|nr:uncharacterized protein LOC107647656 isoform X3 [Arachis ipaensis]